MWSGSADPMPKTPALMSCGRPQRPLDEALEHIARAAFDEVRGAHRLQLDERLAPADGLEEVLRELAADVGERFHAAVGEDREGRLLDLGPVERLLQRVSRGGHERGVEGAAD